MRSKEDIRLFYNRAYAENAYAGNRPLSESHGRGSDLKTILANFQVLDEESVVLEIGCGEGIQMEPVSDFVKEVHGVDISDVAVNHARQFLADKNNCFLYVNDNIEFFPDEYFDVIWEQTVFQHMIREHVLEYIDQSYRKLKPGGHVSFQFNHNPAFTEKEIDGCENQSSWSKEEFTTALSKAGFTAVGINAISMDAGIVTIYYVVARK